MKIKFLISLLLPVSLVLSCKKDNLPAPKIVPDAIQAQVDKLMAVQRDSMRSASSGQNVPAYFTGIKEVDRMLVAQRDSLILSAAGRFAPPPDQIGGGGPCSAHATAGITGTLNGITVNLTANNGAITNFSYSVSGVHGTIHQFGSVIQSNHQGVITYQVTLSGTFNIGGIQVTRNILIYGNFYNCQATTGGLVLTYGPA